MQNGARCAPAARGERRTRAQDFTFVSRPRKEFCAHFQGTREQQAAAPQDEEEENDATEEEVTRERATRVGRPRGGMKVAARSGERLRKEIRRGRLPRVGDG